MKVTKSGMKTITVGEFIDILRKYPEDLPVLTTWEGVCVAIGKGDFSVDFNDYENDNFLFIDADQKY